MKPQNQRMLQGPLLPNILLYAIPIMLTGILQLLFNAADLVVVGRFCGSASVGAVGATSYLTGLIVTLFNGLSVGAGVAVSHALGKNDRDAAQKIVHTSVLLALASGLVLTVIGVSLSGTFLFLMDTPATLLPLSTVYMQIYFCGITFTMIYNFCASILRAAGDTRSPLIFLTIAGVVNVLLNVVFVTRLDMDVAGVALATAISQGISALLAVTAMMRRTDAIRLELRKIRFHKAQLLKIARIGLPAGLQGGLFSISNVIIQSSINSFGDVFMAGNSAAFNLESFVNITLHAFHLAATNFIGQNMGARQYDRIRKTLWYCLGYSIVLGGILGATVYFFGPQLLSIYITDSPQSIADGMIRLTYVTMPYLLFALMNVTSGAIRGLGSSVPPMLISVLGVCGLRLLWVYTVFSIPRFHTPESLYLSYPISWVLTFVCQTAAFILIYRKKANKERLG